MSVVRPMRRTGATQCRVRGSTGTALIGRHATGLVTCCVRPKALMPYVPRRRRHGCRAPNGSLRDVLPARRDRSVRMARTGGPSDPRARASVREHASADGGGSGPASDRRDGAVQRTTATGGDDGPGDRGPRRRRRPRRPSRPRRPVVHGAVRPGDGLAGAQRLRQDHAHAVRGRGAADRPGRGPGARDAGRLAPAAPPRRVRHPDPVRLRRPLGPGQRPLLRRPLRHVPHRRRPDAGRGRPRRPRGPEGGHAVGRGAGAGLPGLRPARRTGAARPRRADRGAGPRAAPGPVGALPRPGRRGHDAVRLQPRHGRGRPLRPVAADARRAPGRRRHARRRPGRDRYRRPGGGVPAPDRARRGLDRSRSRAGHDAPVCPGGPCPDGHVRTTSVPDSPRPTGSCAGGSCPGGSSPPPRTGSWRSCAATGAPSPSCSSCPACCWC